MKTNDGSSLEQLVALIEGRLSPAGFKVETRRPVFDDDGVQIAEFDIVISGRLGTSQISWLIECRDRPSKGTAPGDWIEQLAGRRARFRFDKVMAVSSTGFSPGALQAAEDAGIDLRSLDALTYDEVTAWLPLNAPLIIHRGHYSAVRVFAAAAGQHPDASQERFGLEEKVFVILSLGSERGAEGSTWTLLEPPR